MMLLIALPSSTQLHCTQMLQSSAEKLRRPAKLGIGSVSKPEDGECEVFEEIFREVGSQEHLPERSHCARLAPRPCRRHNKEHEVLVDQL